MLRALRKELVEPTLKRHHGRVVKLMGDGLLAEFASVVDAVAAAVEIQEAIPERSAHLPEARRIALRVGVNIGDVVVEDGDLFGDGVNIAARLQEVSDPNGVAISDGAHRELRGKLELPFADAGEKDLRVRPETLCRITEFSEHESNGRELDEGERVAVEVLPVLGQSAAAVEPGDGAFDHPTPGLDDEALHPIGSLDDLGLEIGQDAGQGAVKDRALIGAVGEQFPEKGKQTEQGRQQRETAVAILNVGGGDDAVQQQALRIDQNMPLLALDQLAGIEAVAVDASPPFSALFTL